MYTYITFEIFSRLVFNYINIICYKPKKILMILKRMIKMYTYGFELKVLFYFYKLNDKKFYVDLINFI